MRTQRLGLGAALLVSAILFSATASNLTAADFVKGINFNGGAVTVDGNSWISHSSALGSGLSFSPAPNVWTSQMTPNPAVNSATSSMLNSAVYSTGNFSFSQTISNGSYHVYFWVMENYQSNARAFDIRLEGNTVATQIGTMNLSSWVKYGPYSANVSDGTLNVDVLRRFGDPHLMGMAIFNATSNPNPTSVQYPTTVEKWGTFEMTLSGPNTGNPYREVSVSANFTRNGTTRNIRGFYDGNGIYRVRFMPDQEGAWTFTTSSSAAAMNGQSGSFSCTSPSGNNHGPVSVRDQFHFQYADGTPYVQLGTTSYDWTNESAQMQEQTINTLAGTKFNKIRFLVFPKYYDFHWDEPEIYPFEGSKGSFDFNRPNFAYFQKFDHCLKRVLELGVEADIILLHSYDNSGINNMGEDNEKRYLEYLIARVGAHRNVWWSMCNEWELKSTDVNYWDRLGQHVQNNDPYNHLRSIHNVWEFYDHHKPWITHLSVQAQEPSISMSKSRDYRSQFGKPVVWDEVRYEGNFPYPWTWGLLTPQEMTEKFWSGTIHGTYVGHSETYTHPEDIIWWSRGGVLRGQSPARIAFLKTIMDMVPGKKLDPLPGNMQAAQNGNDCFLYYYSTSQATNRSFNLPSGNTYQAHVIDTWNMTRSDVGTRSGNFSLNVPNQPYIAVLFIKSGQTQPLPPVASGDSYSTGRDLALTVNAPGVLGNDNDPNGDTLSAILTSGPAHGTLSLQSSGSFTYTPASGYTGGDSFAYKARDSGGLESASVTVTITISLESFVKGINFNGNAVTIDGNQWLSYSAARSSGLSFPAEPNVYTSQLSPNPATNSETAAMLNSSIYAQSSFSFSQTLANGSYNVYFWAMENHQSNFRSFNVRLEGATAASNIGILPYQSWAKYGPYTVTVTDGALSVELLRNYGDPVFSGMAIFSTSTDNNGTIEFTNPVERWGTFEATLTGPSNGNPYWDTTLSATFSQNGTNINASGFYDGNGRYKIRFMPRTQGTWTFSTSSNQSALSGKSGSFTVTQPTGNNHGPVGVRDTYHFKYEDGSPHHQVATTIYNWISQPTAKQDQTIQTLSQHKFNKVRFFITPFDEAFLGNSTVPTLWPFEGSPNNWDFTRPAYATWQNVDYRLGQLRDLGIEAEIILLPGYASYGLEHISGEAENRYLRYTVARLAAYRNVWWSLANEYEFRNTDDNYWDQVFQLVRDADPYGHLRSIHNAYQVYDHRKSWVTHASLQEQTAEFTAVNFPRMDQSRELRNQYGKPVVWDEVRYEGDLSHFWGRINGEEMTRRFWAGLKDGTYVNHSETFNSNIWWRGGPLIGTSPARIDFLAQLVKDYVPDQKLDPVDGNNTAAHNGTRFFIYYFDTAQATSRSFSLPSGNQYQAYVVDTWNMAITNAGVRSGNFTLSIPNNKYMAVMFVQSGVTVNNPPVAAADAYSTGKDVALNISAPGVLNNDSDPNGDSISAILVSGPAHGTLSLQASGAFSYTPASGYSGGDSFTYKARDGGGLESGAVTVTLTVSSNSFVKGINFNGSAVTIEGNAWLSYSAALSSGLSFTASPRVWTSQLTPNPAADTDTRSMLNSAVWNDSSFSFSQTLSNGTYDVYFWVFENYQSNYRSFHVNLEGQQAAANIGTMPYLNWTKYGPYRASVSDGALSVNVIKIAGDPHLMGMAIFSVSGSPEVPVGPGIYLSDLNWTSATSGHGPVERDASNGEINADDGETITLNGVEYAKGLGVHSHSDIRYALNGQFATFLSDVGIDDEVGSNGTVVFQVWLDGTLAYDSGTMNGTSATKSINLNVAGKNELRLVVTNAGDNGNYDHADWAGARLTATGVYLSDLNWISATNGHGPAERDRSNGDLGGSDGATLTLNGVTYAKGLGVHAPSDIKYALNGQYSSLIADLGVDDEVGSNGSVVFQVWLDGTLAYDSGVLTGSSATKAMALDVSGANELRLVVTIGGNNNEYDHADWAVAQLIPAGAASMTAASQSKGTSLTTSLSAQPNPAGVGESVTFIVAANAKGETYAWNFGDGSNGSGATVTHAYAVPGTYTASVAVTNSMGVVRTENLVVTVVEQGFPGSSVEQSIPFTIKAFKGGVNFTRSNSDAVSFSGVLPSGTVMAGQNVRVNVGGVEVAFLVNARGQAKNSSGALKFNSKKGLLSVKLSRGAFSQTWSEQGLLSSQAAAPATSKWLVRIGVNQTAFSAEVNTVQKTKPGVAAQFKKQ